jgi:hypothetical protein
VPDLAEFTHASPGETELPDKSAVPKPGPIPKVPDRMQSIVLQVGGYRLVIPFDRADLEEDVNDQSIEPHDVKAKRLAEEKRARKNAGSSCMNIRSAQAAG